MIKNDAYLFKRAVKSQKHDPNDPDWSQQTTLKSFAIGLKGSPDLIAARAVANHLDTEHYEFHFTVQDGIDAIPDVVSHCLCANQYAI